MWEGGRTWSGMETGGENRGSFDQQPWPPFPEGKKVGEKETEAEGVKGREREERNGDDAINSTFTFLSLSFASLLLGLPPSSHKNENDKGLGQEPQTVTYSSQDEF